MGSSQLQPEFYLTQTKYFDPTATHHQATKQMNILSSQISQSQLEQVIKSMRSQNQLNQMKLKKTSDFMGTYQQYQLNQQKLDQFSQNVSMPKVLKNLEEYEKKIALRDQFMQHLIYDESEARLESTDGPQEESADEGIDLSREESKSEGDPELEEVEDVPCDSEELSKKDEEDLEYGDEIPDDSVEEDSGCDEKLKEAEAELAPLPRSNSFTKFTEPENIEKDISETVQKQVRKRPKSEYRIKRTNQLKRPKTEVKGSEEKPEIENEMEDIRKHLKTI